MKYGESALLLVTNPNGPKFDDQSILVRLLVQSMSDAVMYRKRGANDSEDLVFEQ